MIAPDAFTTGVGIATLTLSAAGELENGRELSSATSEIDRAVVFGLVVENVINCKAAWYWATVAAAARARARHCRNCR